MFLPKLIGLVVFGKLLYTGYPEVVLQKTFVFKEEAHHLWRPGSRLVKTVSCMYKALC